MKIIQHSETILVSVPSRWEWSFYYNEEHSWGSRFDVTEDGELIDPNPDRVRNFEACKRGEFPNAPGATGLYDMGIKYIPETTREERLPRIGLCSCGEKVYLTAFTNTCNCGIDYNMSGQQLAPREQWGEETGETWQEIIYA